MQFQKKRNRRVSVSAEVENLNEPYVKKVVPKSDEAVARIKAAVGNCFLFSSLGSDELDSVIAAMEEKKISPDDVIIKQGATGDFFYIIDQGTFDVYKKFAGEQEEKKVFFYDNKGSFGELALMYNCPRAATVKATSAGVIWALDRASFRHIVVAAHSRQRKLYEQFIQKVPLFGNLSAQERSLIADCLESVEFKDGEAVVKQGEEGDKFYLIEKGTAVALQLPKDAGAREEVEVGRMSEGMYFGERSLLTNEPRAATVKAAGNLKLAAMARDAFERLLGDVKEVMHRTMSQYKSADDLLLERQRTTAAAAPAESS